MLVSNWTAGALPRMVRLNGAPRVEDDDYFPSLRAGPQELWITLNRDLAGAMNRLEVSSEQAPPVFAGVIYVAAGDVNGNGRAEIITGAGAGGGPHVKLFDRNPAIGPVTEQASFSAHSGAFLGDVRVGSGRPSCPLCP